MFKSLYLWEIKKMISLKGVIILLVVAILSLLLINAIFNITIESEFEEVQMTQTQENTPEEDFNDFNMTQGLKLTKEQAAVALIFAQSYLDELEENTKKDRNFYRSIDQIYQARAYVTVIEYIIDNEKYDTEVMPYMGATSQMMLSLENPSSQAFIGLYLSFMSIAILIYGIVCGANAYGKEIKTGTLKMVMLRPISRNKLTLSKLLAALTVSTMFFLGIIVFANIFGAIAYESVKGEFLYVFNAQHAFMGSSNLGMFITISVLMIQIWCYAAFAMALSTISKSSVLGITIPSVVAFGITLLIFTQLGVARFLFSYNAGSIGEFFGIMPSLYGGSNFWLSLPLLIGYVSLFIASTFIVFKKRDIA